jgi:hypothetical protein
MGMNDPQPLVNFATRVSPSFFIFALFFISSALQAVLFSSDTCDGRGS